MIVSDTVMNTGVQTSFSEHRCASIFFRTWVCKHLSLSLGVRASFSEHGRTKHLFPVPALSLTLASVLLVCLFIYFGSTGDGTQGFGQAVQMLSC